MKIDLHMHSTASDGTDTPKLLAQKCAERGLTHAVLTDHDTIAGSEEFMAEARQLGIRTVSGVEFSAEYEGELHILVYGADLQDRQFTSTIEELAQKRSRRIWEMTQRLMDLGIALSHEQVQRYAAGGVPGRPHIAQALVAAGYAASVNEAFQKYLNAGCPGYVKRYCLTREQILSIGRAAGGLPVLAHPKLTCAEDYDGLIRSLAAQGLAGIEAFYPQHSDEECREFCALAKKYGLFVTRGSDCHGAIRPSTYPGKEDRGMQNPLLQEGLRTIFEKR